MSEGGQYVLVRRDGGEGDRVALDPAAPLTMGRSNESGLVLPDASVSRRHARLRFQDGEWWAEDLGSKNGTKLNGAPLRGPERLKPGDVLQLGAYQVHFSGAASALASARVGDVAGPAPATMKSLSIDAFRSGSDTRAFAAGATPERIGSFLRAVDRIGQALVVDRPLEDLFAFVVNLASEVLRADRTALLLRRAGSEALDAKAVKQVAHAGEIVVSRTIARATLEQKQAVLTADAQSDTRFRGHESVIQQRIHSAMCAPLWHENDVLGLLYVDNVAAPAPFTEMDLRLLTLLAHLAAVKIRETEQQEAVERARRLAEELRRAAALQQALLPTEALRVGRALVAGRNVPSFDVGGDYFDYLEASPGSLFAALGDVAGKGMSAALLMTHLHASVRAQIEIERPLAAAMEHLNRSMHRNVRGLRFLTLFLGTIDGTSGEVRYVNGGHNPPLLVRRSGGVEALDVGGLLLGMFPDASYEEGRARMEDGDTLVAYSDGVTDARNPAAPEEEFGEDRLREYLVESRGLSPEALAEELIRRVRAFGDTDQLADDVTVAVIRFGS